MIIVCNHCNKKFELEPTLIPEEGRLLQCSSCDYQWFYKKKTNFEKEIILEDKNIEAKKPIRQTKKININQVLIEDNQEENDIKIPAKNKKNIKKKKIGILNFMLVFLISFIALIIVIDTFKSQIKLLIPNIDSILNSLYETIKDIILFLKDLF